jgi:hypothetical protein
MESNNKKRSEQGSQQTKRIQKRGTTQRPPPPSHPSSNANPPAKKQIQKQGTEHEARPLGAARSKNRKEATEPTILAQNPSTETAALTLQPSRSF